MKMDRRKSSLVFGSRTGKNILKGRNIRKGDDGVHIFDDYWTDSGSESTEESISQTQQSPSLSDARLATSQEMDRKKLSLVFGSRTGRNILKGRNIRKGDDGVDNFADYFTDSGSKGTEKSTFLSESSQTQQSPGITDARLSTLRQSVRKSKDSHFQTEIGDRLDRSELTKSLLKSVKRNILSSDKDVNTSPTKKQILSQRRQQAIQGYSTRNLSNTFTVTDNLGSHHEVESNVSNTIQRSTSNGNCIRGQTENTAVSQDRETSDEVVNITVTQNNDESSENVDKEGCIQSRTFRHSRHVRDQSTSCPILQNSGKKVRETSVTPKKGPTSRNVDDSLKILQNSTCDASVMGNHSENTMSSQFSKKSNKMEEKFVMQKNIPGANLNNSDIRILSKSKVTYKVIDSDDGIASERNPLSDKTFNERNKAVGVSEQVSNALTTSFGNRTVRKMGNSLQVSKKFAKYDEYDAEIMLMMRQNEQNLRTSETYFSVATNPVEEIKTKSITSKKPIQSTEESYDRIALERSIMNANKSQNSRNVRSSNRVRTRSQLKSSEFGDEIIKELSGKSTITEKGNSEVAHISLTSQHSRQSQSEHDLSSDSKQKLESSQVDKSGQLRAEDRSLRSKSSAVKSPSKRKSTVLPITCAKKRLTSSAETFPKPVCESGTEKGNSEVANILTSQHNHPSQIEHCLSSDSNQKLESSSKVDKNGQLRAEERSPRSKSNADKSPSKRISTAMNITYAKKRSTENQNMSRSRLNSESGTETDEANGIEIDQVRSEANIAHTDELDDDLLNVDSRRTLVDKTNEKMKATETFIKDNFKRGVDIPEVGNVTISRLDKKSKKRGKALDYLSRDKINSASKIPKVKNKTTPSLGNKKKKHVDQHNENIPEIFDSDEPPGKKKNQKKTVVPSDSVDLRRSSRQKFPPLARWRSERLEFRVEDGIINFAGINPGTAEDDGAIRQLLNRMKKWNKMKKKKEAKERKVEPKCFKLDDVVQKRKVRVPVVKKFHYTPWDKGYRGDRCPYRIKKVFETCNCSCGFIQIEINEEKPIQYMPDEDLNLTVIKGKVQVTVQDNIIVGEEKDMFMIPRLIPYSLKNVGSTKALLVFCVAKFQYLESEG